MPERVQVYSGVMVLSMRCTHPGTNRGLKKDNYLVRLFLARRLRAFVGNLRFGLLFPRALFLFRLVLLALLDLSGRAGDG